MAPPLRPTLSNPGWGHPREAALSPAPSSLPALSSWNQQSKPRCLQRQQVTLAGRHGWGLRGVGSHYSGGPGDQLSQPFKKMHKSKFYGTSLRH